MLREWYSCSNSIPILRHNNIRPAFTSERIRVFQIPTSIRGQQSVKSGLQGCARSSECTAQCRPIALSLSTCAQWEIDECDNEQRCARPEHPASVQASSVSGSHTSELASLRVSRLWRNYEYTEYRFCFLAEQFFTRGARSRFDGSCIGYQEWKRRHSFL